MEMKYRDIKAIFEDGWHLGPGFPLRHISKFLGRKVHVTKIRGAGTVHMRTGSSDPEVFLQVFRKKEYDIWGPQRARVLEAYQRILNENQVPVIVDAGANVGAASIWFAKKFPSAFIVAIEPDSDNAAMCRLNTRDLAHFKLIEAAIGSEPGNVSLSNPKKQAYSVRTIRSGEGNVAVRTVPDIAREAPPHSRLFLVKIDIEGFEDDLFAKNTEWLDSVEVVMIEPHDRLFPGKRTSRNFQKALADRSFEILISGENLIYARV